MRPFKKYMLLEYWPVPEFGIYGDRVTSSPWYLKVRVIDWWGLRDRTITTKVQVPFSLDVTGFYEPKLNKWLTN